MTLRWHYDEAADAAYLRFSEDAVVESEEVSPGVVIDFDAAGRLVALEVLGARSRLPAGTLAAAA